MAIPSIVRNLALSAVGAFAVLGSVSTAHAATFDLTASDQGWWNNGSYGHSSDNDNYITGQYAGSDFRSYFTFNLPNVSPGELVTSAVLQLKRFDGTGNPNHTLGLFDVSTSAFNLDQNSAPNTTIFNDLGSGKSYGQYTVSTGSNGNEILNFALNLNGITDINNSLGKSFSIGGSLLDSFNSSGNYLFGSSGVYSNHLVLTTAPTAVPTPALLPGLIALGVGVLRKRKAEAANQTNEV